MKKENLETLEGILLGEKESIIVKGQILSIMKNERAENKAIYYTFVMKILKHLSNDEYGQSFNTINIVMPSEYVANNKITDEEMKDLKNNEVVCVLASDSHAKRMTGSNNTFYYVNNVNYYVIEMIKTKELEKVSFGSTSKPIAL
jgi:hypothetical protein